MARTGLVAAVLLVAVAGCASRVGGVPVAGPVPSEPPASAAEVLGDLTTVEPCSLTDPEVFAEFGAAAFGTPESLDYCTISIEPDAGTDVVVMVGQLGLLDQSPELVDDKIDDVADGIFTAQRSDSPDSCAQALVFVEDGITLDVTASTYAGEVATTCDMVAAGMAGVVEVVEAEEVEHRSPRPNSLVPIDPCDLVADQVVVELPGFATAQREDNPGRHQCYWSTGEGDDRLAARIMFNAGPRPTPYGTGGNTDPIAGRPSVTNPIPDAGTASYCTVETGQIPFEEVEGQTGMVEVAAVFVRMPAGQVGPACQAAVALATMLWPRLPAP